MISYVSFNHIIFISVGLNRYQCTSVSSLLTRYRTHSYVVGLFNKCVRISMDLYRSVFSCIDWWFSRSISAFLIEPWSFVPIVVLSHIDQCSADRYKCSPISVLAFASTQRKLPFGKGLYLNNPPPKMLRSDSLSGVVFTRSIPKRILLH